MQPGVTVSLIPPDHIVMLCKVCHFHNLSKKGKTRNSAQPNSQPITLRFQWIYD